MNTSRVPNPHLTYIKVHPSKVQMLRSRGLIDRTSHQIREGGDLYEPFHDFELPGGMSVFDDTYNLNYLISMGYDEMPADLIGTVPVPSIGDLKIINKNRTG